MLKCPKCGNTNYNEFLFIETRKGKINWWVKAIIHTLCAALFFWGLYELWYNKNFFAVIGTLIIWAITAGILKAISYQKRRKTSTKVICPRCGNTWFID